MLVCGCDPLDSARMRGGDTLQCTGFATHQPFDRYFFLQPTREAAAGVGVSRQMLLGSSTASRVPPAYCSRQVGRVLVWVLGNLHRSQQRFYLWTASVHPDHRTCSAGLARILSGESVRSHHVLLHQQHSSRLFSENTLLVTSKLKKKFPAAVLLTLVFPRRQITRSAKRMRRLTRLGGTSNTPAVRRVKGSRHLSLPAAGVVSELWGGSYGSIASICRLVRSGLRLLGSTASTLPFHSVIRIVAPDCWPLLPPVAWWEIEPFVSRDVSHSTPNNR